MLQWALNLERDGVRGENFAFTPREQEIASATQNISNVTYNAPVTITNVQSFGDNAIIVTAGEIDRTRINGIVEQLRSVEDRLELTADDRAELKSERETLEAQLASPKPKREIVMGALRSVWRIVEGAAAGAAAVPLLDAVRKVLGI